MALGPCGLWSLPAGPGASPERRPSRLLACGFQFLQGLHFLTYQTIFLEHFFRCELSPYPHLVILEPELGMAPQAAPWVPSVGPHALEDARGMEQRDNKITLAAM